MAGPDHQGRWDFPSCTAAGTQTPTNIPLQDSSTRATSSAPSPFSLLVPSNQLHFFRKLKSCHKQNTTFLRLPYTGGNYPESQVNLQGSPSAQCTALHQVEVSTALQKPCLGQQLPHDIPHPHLCSVPWPKPSAPTGHSVTDLSSLLL